MSPEKQETQAHKIRSVITFSCESEEASSVRLLGNAGKRNIGYHRKARHVAGVTKSEGIPLTSLG